MLAGWAMVTALSGQQSLESEYRMTGCAVVAAFESQRAVLQSSSAVIFDGREPAGYGVVISAQGHLLAKASEYLKLKAPTITVDRTNLSDVTVVAVDPVWDVVLLKVAAVDWLPVVYAATSAVPQGTWVVANGATTRTTRRLLVGIISANPREIPAEGGTALGVLLKAKSTALEIDDVCEPSGAKQAGLQKGDVIVAIAGQAVSKLAELTEALKGRKAGSVVALRYRRGQHEQTVDVRLVARGEIFTDPMNGNDQMSGDFSNRRSGFPRVIQHDILGTSKLVGGPLLDLEGRCLGMNIARANRAESFAIPVEELQSLAARMLDGAPKLP